MSKRCLVLDLDDTIADTSKLSSFRDARDWQRCKANLNLTKCFLGIADVIALIRSSGIPVGVVTASPSNYANNVLSHHGISVDNLVAYHDCTPRKPHPAPVLMCIRNMNSSAAGSLGVGDAEKDATAYMRAGIVSYGAGWSPHLDISAPWDKIIESPAAILDFFKLA